MFKKFKQLLTIFTITCGFITNNSLAAQENNNKKLLLNNGVIYTANSQNQHPQAIGIINGEIIAIGSEKEVQTKLGKDFQTLDLKGNFLMPGLIDTHVHVRLLPSYKKLIEKMELNAHVSALLLVNINSDASIVKDVLDIKNKFELLPDLSIKGVKILQDGVIEYLSQTAKLSESYIGKGDYSGPLNIDKNKYDLNHSVTHLEVVNPNDFKRFKELGIDCSMQFLWAGKSAPTTTLLEGSVPDNLLKVLYPANSLIKSGALVAGASDWPVSTPNPFLAIHTALTRMGDEGVLLPKNEIISRDDILKAYTINAANLIGYGDKIGSIEIGKKADFTLLDKNLEEVSVNEIPKTKVIWTMFNGTIIYSIN